jgi:hypothetical protein
MFILHNELSELPLMHEFGSFSPGSLYELLSDIKKN